MSKYRNRSTYGAGHGPYSTTEMIDKACDDYQNMRQEQKMEEYSNAIGSKRLMDLWKKDWVGKK